MMKTALTSATATLALTLSVVGAGEGWAASCATAGTAYAAYPGVSCGTFAGRTQESNGSARGIIQAASEVGVLFGASDIIAKSDENPSIFRVAISERDSRGGTQGVVTSSVPFTILGLKAGNNPFNYAFYTFDAPVTAAAFNTFDAGLVNGGGNAPAMSFAVAALPLPAAVWLFASAFAGLGLLGRRRNAV
jgi:hypothetical protein